MILFLCRWNPEEIWNVEGSLYVGGYPGEPPYQGVRHANFSGCIESLHLDSGEEGIIIKAFLTAFQAHDILRLYRSRRLAKV